MTLVLSAIAFHEKAGRSQAGSVVFSLDKLVASTGYGPGRPAKTVIDFPETGRHNRFQTLQVRNRSSAFLFSRRLATS